MEERSQIQLLCVAVDVGFSSLSADRWAAFPGGFQNRGRLDIQGGAGQHREDPARVSKASLGGLGCVTQGTGHPLVSGPPPRHIKGEACDDFCQPVDGKAGARSGALHVHSYHLLFWQAFSPSYELFAFEKRPGSLPGLSQVVLTRTLARMENSPGKGGCVISSFQ